MFYIVFFNVADRDCFRVRGEGVNVIRVAGSIFSEVHKNQKDVLIGWILRYKKTLFVEISFLFLKTTKNVYFFRRQKSSYNQVKGIFRNFFFLLSINTIWPYFFIIVLGTSEKDQICSNASFFPMFVEKFFFLSFFVEMDFLNTDHLLLLIFLFIKIFLVFVVLWIDLWCARVIVKHRVTNFHLASL